MASRVLYPFTMPSHRHQTWRQNERWHPFRPRHVQKISRISQSLRPTPNQRQIQNHIQNQNHIQKQCHIQTQNQIQIQTRFKIRPRFRTRVRCRSESDPQPFRSTVMCKCVRTTTQSPSRQSTRIIVSDDPVSIIPYLPASESVLYTFRHVLSNHLTSR